MIRHQSFKSISTFLHLKQEAQLEEPPAPPPPLPLNPSSGSSRYSEDLRNPAPVASAALVTTGSGFRNQPLQGPTPEALALMDEFADLMTQQKWDELMHRFEIWIQSDDASGKKNRPDVDLYNQYLRANFMRNASAATLLDLVAKMEDFWVLPNTATYNLVLKAMQMDGQTAAAEKLLERMLQTGKEDKESLPDEESYDIVIGMFLSSDQIDSALKYIDLTLKSGFALSMKAFIDCVQKCVNKSRLDTLVSIIERCKKMDQNKSLCPPWRVCNYIAEYALQADNSDLAFYALSFIAQWIYRGERTSPPVLLSVDEGLVISALGTAGRNYHSKLLDGSWKLLQRSLRDKRYPSPESYLGKIYAYANLGNLPRAFVTLQELEKTHGSSCLEDGEDLFSPFNSLNPLVLACSKKSFVGLDAVYYQLEAFNRDSEKPYKSLAALNCLILGCANIWDLDRAYQTFNSIDSTFGLTPNVHSYNALICAFKKLGMRDEAVKVFEHFVALGVKPNVTTYSLLVDSHLIKRDPKSALSVIDEMIHAGFEPSREILKKVRRRCTREMDYESDEKVGSLAKQFKIRMGMDTRQNTLFTLQYSTAYA